jgi:hypothetical protein
MVRTLACAVFQRRGNTIYIAPSRSRDGRKYIAWGYLGTLRQAELVSQMNHIATYKEDIGQGVHRLF